MNKYSEKDLINAQQALNQEWINKNLLDPQEVQNNYTKLENERDQWKTELNHRPTFNDLDAIKHNNTLLSNELTNANKQISELISTYQKDNQTWTAKKQELADLVIRAAKGIEKLNASYQETKKEVARLTTDLTPWTDNFPNKTALNVKQEQERLQNQLAIIQTNLEQWTNQFPNLTSKNVAETIKDLEFDLTFTSAEFDATKKDLECITAERDSRASITPNALKALNERKTYLEHENEFQQRDLEDYEDELTKSNEHNEKLTQDNELKTNRINRLKSHTEILANRYKDAKTNYQSSQGELEEKTTQLQKANQAAAKLKDQNNELEGKFTRLQNEAINSEKTRLQQATSIEDLTSELNEAKTNLEATQANLTDSEKARRQTKIALKKEQIKQQQTSNEKDDYQQQRDQKLVELSEERTNHHQTQQNLNATTEQLNQTQAQKTRLEGELAQSQSENSKLEGKITRLENDLIQAGKTNAEKEAIITNLAAEQKETQEWKTKYEKLNQEQKNKDNLLERLITSLAGAAAGYTINRALTENDIEELTEKVEELQEQNEQMANHWRNHNCTTINNINCNHNDYEAIRTNLAQTQTGLDQAKKELNAIRQERDNLQSQLTTALQEKEQALTKQKGEIIQQFNQDLKLDLKEPNLEAIISRIKELIGKPPQIIFEETSPEALERELNQANQTIIRLEKELQTKPEATLAEAETISPSELKQLAELFSEDPEIKQSIEKATTYRQVVAAQQAFIQKQLGKQNKNQAINSQQALNQPKTETGKERIIWIGLLITALLTIGGLLLKLKTKKRK